MIVIKYPPIFDGETHIEVKDNGNSFSFSFAQSKSIPQLSAFSPGVKHSEWTALVEVAKAIIAQDDRRKSNQ